jgi:hypothetical protein
MFKREVFGCVGVRGFARIVAGLGVCAAMLVASGSARAAGGPVLGWSQGATTITSYDFGTFDVGGGQTPTPVTFTLTNSGESATGDLAITLPNTSGSAFSITSDRCSGRSLGARKSCTITVAFVPGGSVESDAATLTATGEHASASLPLSGATRGVPLLAWSQGGTTITTYGYGPVPAGNILTQTFTLTNSGTGATEALTTSLTGSKNSAGDDAFSIPAGDDGCTGQTLAANGGTCTVTVQYQPTASGENSGDTGTLSAGGQDLALTGSGGPQDLTLSKTGDGTFSGPFTLADGSKKYVDDFGSSVASASATFTVTNDGTGTSEPLKSLTFVPGSDNNGGFSISNDHCGGTSLASGASCTFGVNFAEPSSCAGAPSDGDIFIAGTKVRYIDLYLRVGECAL